VDTGDRNIEYQALEGRSSVAYQQKKYGSSDKYLTSALTALSSDSVMHSAAARERIIGKIKGIMKIQLQQDNQLAPQQTSVCGLQPCVNGDWLCQWEMAIFNPPQNKHPLTDHQKIWYR